VSRDRDLKPDKTTTAHDLGPLVTITPAEPRLRSVRFREPVTLAGVTPETHVVLGDRVEAQVVGASVFVRRDRDDILEIPRSACVLRYAVPESMTLADAVRLLTGKGSK
jgi:hypothetical protein